MFVCVCECVCFCLTLRLLYFYLFFMLLLLSSYVLIELEILLQKWKQKGQRKKKSFSSSVPLTPPEVAGWQSSGSLSRVLSSAESVGHCANCAIRDSVTGNHRNGFDREEGKTGEKTLFWNCSRSYRRFVGTQFGNRI